MNSTTISPHKNPEPVSKGIFFELLHEIIQEYLEDIKSIANSCNVAIRSLECAIRETRLTDKLNELLKNEIVEDYQHLISCPDDDRASRLLQSWEKRLQTMAKDYWKGMISRDELI